MFSKFEGDSRFNVEGTTVYLLGEVDEMYVIYRYMWYVNRFSCVDFLPASYFKDLGSWYVEVSIKIYRRKEFYGWKQSIFY
jgi:hypothetical protein